MLTELLNKLLYMCFFISILNTLRHGFYFFRILFSSNSESDRTYILPNYKLILLGISMAYILCCLFRWNIGV